MPRLTADMRIGAIRRLAESEGGFAMVVARGDSTSGDIVLLIAERSDQPAVFRRLMTMDGDYRWGRVELEKLKDSGADAYVARSRARDPDLWVLELIVPDMARFIEWLENVN